MITELTPEQQADIQPTIDGWIKNASEPTDKEVTTQVVYDIYKKYNHKQPQVVFVSSPLAAVVLHHIWEDFWKRFLNDNPRLRASLSASLGDSLGDSLSDSLSDSLRASLSDSLSASLGDSLYPLWWHWWYGGYAIVDFAKRNLGLFQDNTDADLWIRLGQNIQIMLPSTNVVIIVEKPTEVHFSEVMTPKVLDYDHGMSVKYADGWGIYNLRGVLLNEEQYTLIMSGDLDATQIAKLSSEGKLNADQAAVAWQFLGANKLLNGMNAKLIATGTKHAATLNRLGEDKCREKYLWAFRPETELYQVDNFMDTGRTEYCIKMWHPTVENAIYVEWVEPAIGKKKDADLAQASAFSIDKKDYMKAYEA